MARRQLPRVASFALVLCLASALSAPGFAAKPKADLKPTSKSAPAASQAPATPAPSTPSAPPSLADTLSDEAKSDYESGKSLYGDGAYASARVKFQAAYDLSHDPRLLWNVAVCEKAQRHYAKVVLLVKKYLETGADLLSQDDRKEAQDLLNAIESFSVGLSLTVNEPDAQIWIDGEPIGSSPLPGSVTVDIGARQIEVRKPGFLPFSQSFPVGGNQQAALAVKLEREVHEGELTVRAPPKATIFIDAKPVGLGRFVGNLPSGGHTLRVDAPGYRSYQSEVVVQDRERRAVDVALEPIAPPAAAPVQPEGPLHGLEIGLRTGYGKQTNRVSLNNGSGPDSAEQSPKAKFIPFGLDIGYRLARPTYLGVFGQYGTLDRSSTCGVARHGPHQDFPGDAAVRYGYTSCYTIKFGVALVFHVLPRTIVDPYFGFEAALHGTIARYRSFDPTTGQTATGSDRGNGPSFQPGFQVGIDSHPIPTLGAGIYAVFGPSLGSEGEPQDNGNNCSSNTGNGSSNNCQNASSNVGSHFVFGVRTAYTFQ
jgi:hypothetical protein